ncbi:hydrolase, alpha/beta domain protein [Aeromicrobium marinum DSM 15272]|uniref:Hydrolase, alpha/beta domain protein n=1 Tax=Aeromicrobium marinum DSM 15272 TaxID=585531 RepID=E2SG51_9ACTN|nr:alpha/beta hydrolase [Aeromicrobium marinum]EFQ81808.1 hydrolase, alpha/beta domain protein [Aeromicrobium marinum DSM 15272]
MPPGPSVDLWFADRGEGEPFVLLHPGGVDSRALDPLLDGLTGHYRLITPDQRGHGRTPDVDGPLGHDLMAADTAALIDRLGCGPVHLFGYSDGAIVALHVALARPDLVRDLVFAAAPFHHEGWHAGVLDGDPPAFLADSYGEVSPDGRDHWPVVVAKLDRMHHESPVVTTEQLHRLTLPVLVVLGDDDEVRLEHAVEMYQALPDGELAVVPRSTHAVIVEKPDLLVRLVRDFHDPDKGDGYVPLRRAGRG